MSRPRAATDLLADILTAAGQAERFTAGLGYDEFAANDLVVFAVVRTLEIIGEAAKRLPLEVRGRAADVPWQDIVGMRNRLAHDYIHVDHEVVWQVVQTDLKALAASVARLRIELLAENPPPAEPLA